MSLERVFKVGLPSIAILVLLVAFQNCQFSDSFKAPSDTRPNKSITNDGGLQGNGGGYTGKINIAAPSQVSEDQPYIVVIEGGEPPYNITSPQGEIEILNISGNVYELRNRFTLQVTQFDLEVSDSQNNKAFATIAIVASDNVFNYSHATAALSIAGNTYIFDNNLRSILVFDSQGLPITTLNPMGDKKLYFESYVDLANDSNGNIFVLEPLSSRLSVFDSKFQFLKATELSAMVPGISAQSLTVHNDQVFIVDGSQNVVLPLDSDGHPMPPLELNGAELNHISSVAFDDVAQKIYLADSGAKDIKVYRNGQLTDTITEISTVSGNKSFLGPERLAVSETGAIYLIDRIWLEGPYKGATSGYFGDEWTWKLIHSTGSVASAQKVSQRSVNSWHTISDCLTVQPNRITYCDPERYLVTIDDNGEVISHIDPRSNALETVNEPYDIIADAEGNSFVLSDYNYVTAIGSDLKIMYRKLGWGTDVYRTQNITGMAVIEDRLYISSAKLNTVRVYEKYSFNFLFEFSITDSLGQVTPPHKMISSGNQLVFFSGYDNFILYDANGNKVKAVHRVLDEQGQVHDLSSFRDFSADDSGLIYYLDTKGKITRVIDTQSEQIVRIFKKDDYSDTIHVDSLHQLIFYGAGNSIHYFSMKTGEALGTFGVGGITPGAFNSITGIGTSENFVHVSDLYNQRVQKISLQLFKNIQ